MLLECCQWEEGEWRVLVAGAAVRDLPVELSHQSYFLAMLFCCAAEQG